MVQCSTAQCPCQPSCQSPLAPRTNTHYIYKLCIYPEDVNTGCHENMGTLTCHWSKGKLHTSRSECVCVCEALTCWRYSLTGVWQKIGKNCTLFSSALRQRLHFWEDSKHTHRLFFVFLWHFLLPSLLNLGNKLITPSLQAPFCSQITFAYVFTSSLSRSPSYVQL